MTLTRPMLPLPGGPLWLGVNFWSQKGGPLMWRTYDDELVRRELQVLADHGLTLTRSFFFWPDFQPAPHTIDESYVDLYRQFLRASEDIGIQTIPTFIVGHMSGQNFDVPWRQGRDLYSDSWVVAEQAYFIREMVRRVKDSPAIAGWLISNEMPIFAGNTTPDYATSWGEICTQAVRAGGSDLPVSLGDGAWTQEVVGRDNGFRLREIKSTVDFIGPHVYPMGNDQVRQLLRAGFVCELSHVGELPVVLEEFGVTSSFVSDANAGHYYRHVLHHSLLAGAVAWIGWNNTDFDLPDQVPYSHHIYEWGFGVTRTDHTPKAPLLELAEFRRVLDAVGLDGLSRPDTRTAILLSSFIDDIHPMLPPQIPESIPDILYHSWIAAKQADLAPGIAREYDGVPDADLIIVPSTRALVASTWDKLLDAARDGSHVFASWFPGIGRYQSGAWWPDLEPIFGVRHKLRYGLLDAAPDSADWTVTSPFGGLERGEVLSFPPPADIEASFLPVELADDPGVEVLAVDAAGNPALVRRRVGSGAVYLCTYPIEYFGSARPNAFPEDTWRLYRALANAAGIEPALRVDSGDVIADQLVHADGRRFGWLLNVTPDPQTVRPEAADGSGFVDALDGSTVDKEVELPPFGVRVLRFADADGAAVPTGDEH